MKKLMILDLLVLLTLIIYMGSCKKDSSNETPSPTPGVASMDVHMTDASGLYDKVLVDIEDVQINVEGKGWIPVKMTRRGIYNLLDFNNGNDTVLAASVIPSGRITQIRLILGSSNYVVIGGITSSMEAPSSEESGLKINIDQTIPNGGAFTLWLDFNAEKSVVVKGNGGFALKPVIRGFLVSSTGSLSGDVDPDNAAYYVYAIRVNANDTFATYPRTTGYFKMTGLPQGVYTVYFTNSSNSVVKMMGNVSVTANHETNLGIVTVP